VWRTTIQVVVETREVVVGQCAAHYQDFGEMAILGRACIIVQTLRG
jgi:hypothetical protein